MSVCVCVFLFCGGGVIPIGFWVNISERIFDSKFPMLVRFTWLDVYPWVPLLCARTAAKRLDQNSLKVQIIAEDFGTRRPSRVASTVPSRAP